jgi:amino acid adenylation domain-containing protein/non-ribosomal peptide synthase protein (TIGR01720 family)
MIYHASAAPASGCDIEQVVVKNSRTWNPAEVRSWFEKLTARHDALRVFVQAGEVRPSLGVAAVAELPWQEKQGTVAEFEAWLQVDRFRDFDLTTAPLQRFCLWSLPSGEMRLVWTFHHLLLDGRSMVSLLQEAFSGKAGPVQAVGSYLNWQASQEVAGESFWRQHLQGFAPVPLQIDGIGSLTSQPSQKQAKVKLSLAETQQLQAYLAEHSAVSMNTLVMAAWLLVLSRYSGQSSITTGATRACRHVSYSGIEHFVGLAINTVPFKAEVEAETSVAVFLQSLRETWVAMRPYELAPLTQIRRWAGLSGNASLFEHLVVYDHEDLNVALHRLEPSWEHLEFELHELTTVPLTLQAYGGSQLKLQVAYDTSRFSAELIQALLSHVQHALLGLTSAQTLGEIALTPESPTLPPPTQIPATGECLHTWFDAVAAEFPHRLALSGEDAKFTYAELAARANQLAHHLLVQGVRPGELVGLRVSRNSSLVVGVLAILKAGAAYLPMDLSYPADRIAFMMEDSEARIVLVDSAADPVGLGEVQIVIDIPSAYAHQSKVSPVLLIQADSPAYCIFTSGSTGKPKGCLISHHNVTRLMRQTEHWFGFAETDVWSLFHSSAFDFSVWEIWGALLYGGRVAVVPYHVSRSPEDFLHYLSREGVTVLNQTPSAFRQLMAADEMTQPTVSLALRYVVFGGEALEMRSLQPWFQRRGDLRPQLVNMYGITETTVHVTYRALTAADCVKGSVIGEPIPDLHLVVLDPQQRPCPVGIPGEMYVGGAGLAIGYLKRPELTAARFIAHPQLPGERLYRTGDLARYLPDGELEYLGRIDQQVKIRGFRIELGEIVSVLLAHPGIREAAVYPMEENGVKKLVAWLVPQASEVSVDELRQHLKSSIPDYMVPADFVFLSRMPMTNNGKLDRQALPAPQRSVSSQWEAPRNPTESALAAVWAKVLRRDKVGITEDFFEIGGDSILSIHLISAARKVGLQFSPKQLFDHPTIAQLALVVRGSAAVTAVSESSVATVRPLPIHEWFFAQQLSNPHWYNQAYRLKLKQPTNAEALRLALLQVIAHHQALRLRIPQRIEAPSESDLHFAEVAVLQPEVAQRSVNFATGPLVSAQYDGAELLLVIQHLAVDAISWGILLEDLEAALLGQTLAPVPTPYANIQRQELAWPHELRASAVLAGRVGENTEASVLVERLSLTQEETAALLTTAPVAYGARIHELLVAALFWALRKQSSSDSVAINLEGHGRESLYGEADLTRTVGWFTSIYPVTVQLPSSASLGQAVRAVKEYLRALPAKGAGFDASQPETPDLLLNYLGQVDSLTAHSTLFAAGSEDVGPTHAPENLRRYAHELESEVRQGRFQLAWRYSRNLHDAHEVKSVLEAFGAALRTLLTGAGVKAARSAADFPLARLTDQALEQMLATHPDAEDVFPLSPMQQLFLSTADRKASGGFDTWSVDFEGELDVLRLKNAWNRIAERHPLLRVTLWSDGGDVMQVVGKEASVEWELSENEDLAIFGKRNSAIRIHEIEPGRNRFVWRVPELFMDGWSWPVLFRDLGVAYRGESFTEAAPSYANYIAWLQAQSKSEAQAFWAGQLGTLTEPTSLPVSLKTRSKGQASFRKFERIFEAPALPSGVKLAEVLHAAWALVLQKVGPHVTFGTAVSGRPAELPGVGNIIGPFTNNLPLRLDLAALPTVQSLWDAIRGQLRAMQAYQHTHPADLHDASRVPWKDRLFQSLLVVQNYQVDAQSLQWMENLRLSQMDGPLHSNYPLMMVVTPEAGIWKLEVLVPDFTENVAPAEQVLAAFAEILEYTVANPTAALLNVPNALEAPPREPLPPRVATLVPPKSGVEQQLLAIWQRAFGTADISTEDNFFDIGGHSLLMLRVHSEITKQLAPTLGLVKLFQFPTIAALAAHLSPAGSAPKGNTNTAATNARNRVAAARAAMAQRS